MTKAILTIIALALGIGLPLLKWYLGKAAADRKKKEETYENLTDKIDSNAPVGDVQSDIDDLLNRL